MINKPSAFKLLDFLMFGGPAVITSVLTAYVSLSNHELSLPMVLVAVAFVSLYVGVVLVRAKFLSRFQYMTSQGVMVNFGNYDVTGFDVENEVWRTLELYKKYFENAEKLLESEKVWLTFKPGPFGHPTNRTVKVAGFVTYGGESAYVGYLDPRQPITETALAHEIGHVIIGRATKNWDQETHHKFMADNKLP